MLKKIKHQLQRLKESVTSKPSEQPSESIPATVSQPKAPTGETVFVDIKTITIVRTVAVIVGLLYLARVIEVIGSVLVLLLMAVIIESALGPTVDRWEKRGYNRILSATILYVIILALLTIIVSSFVPIVGNQVMELASNVRALVEKVTSGITTGIQQDDTFLPRIGEFLQEIDREQLIGTLQEQLQNIGLGLASIAGNVWSAIGTFFGGLLSFLLVLILSFYMIIQRHSFEDFLATLIPSRYEPYILAKSQLVRHSMGAWLRGQLTVCSLVAAMALIGLAILGVDYALTLALFAGIMAIIPYMGPLLGAIPAILIAFTISPWTALFVAILYFVIIQFLESNVITPLIMKRAVGLNPVTIIVVLLIGGKLYGILGILLAIPVTTAMKIFVKDLQHKEKKT